MISTKVKVLVTVFALFLVTSIVTVGCGQKPIKKSWVGTETLPGQTFKSNASTSSSAKRASSTIVYLGSDKHSSGEGFGPRDVDFEFQALR